MAAYLVHQLRRAEIRKIVTNRFLASLGGSLAFLLFPVSCPWNSAGADLARLLHLPG